MTNTDPPPKKWLTAKAAAEYLGIGRTTLYDWIRTGRVPVHRAPSGRPKFDPVELRAIIKPESREAEHEERAPGEGP